MVDVRVGQQDEVQLLGRNRQGLVFKQVFPLLHAVVDDAALVADLKIGTAARDLMGSAEKGYFHCVSLLTAS